MKAASLLVVFMISAAEVRAEEKAPDDVGALNVFKCCRKGEMLDAEGMACVRRPGSQVEKTKWEELLPPMNASDAYWLPPTLRTHRLHVTYNLTPREYKGLFAIVAADETMVWRFMKVESTLRKFELKPFKFPVNTYSIWYQNYCFDASEDTSRPLVIYTQIKLRTLFKCCSKGARLDAKSMKCELAPETTISDVDNEVLNPNEDGNVMKWLPKSFRTSIIHVKYNRGPSFQWNVIIDSDNESNWRMVEFREYDWHYKVRVVTTNSTQPSVGVTRTYCFDEIATGSQSKRILLALLANITKCCKKGEQFNSYVRKCVPRPDSKIKDIDFAVIDPNQDPDTAYWMPKTLRGKKITVRYKYEWFQYGHVVLRAEKQRGLQIQYHDHDEPTLSLLMSTPSGKDRNVSTREFCFDAVADGPLSSGVLITPLCYASITCLPKCCPTGELLQTSGNDQLSCAQHSGTDWKPYNSSLTKSLDPDEVYSTETFTHSLCTRYSYNLENPGSAEEFARRLLKTPIEEKRFSTKYFCADLLRGSAGEQEVLASCVLPPSASIYEKVRPLQALAALLLLLAVAWLLGRRRPRRSAHGRALLCHALCLLAANALQMAWFFTHRRDQPCHGYAYSVYFFLIAGGFWLNVISINMACGFRRPLRALTSGGGGGVCGSGGGGGGAASGGAGAGGVAGGGWRRFACLSAYAWGCPAALCALAVFMDAHDRDMQRRGFVTPTFFETRTCAFEYVSTEISVRGEVVRSDNQLGALVYYYVPSAVLVLTNAVCLGLTLRRIAELRKDSALLGGSAHTLRSAVLYVKLLLTAGAAELLLEATAWGARRRRFYGQWLWKGEYSAETAFVFAIVAAFVDVARAAAVLWLSVGGGGGGRVGVRGRAGCKAWWRRFVDVFRCWAHRGVWRPRKDTLALANPTYAKNEVECGGNAMIVGKTFKSTSI